MSSPCRNNYCSDEYGLSKCCWRQLPIPWIVCLAKLLEMSLPTPERADLKLQERSNLWLESGFEIADMVIYLVKCKVIDENGNLCCRRDSPRDCDGIEVFARSYKYSKQRY